MGRLDNLRHKVEQHPLFVNESISWNAENLDMGNPSKEEDVRLSIRVLSVIGGILATMSFIGFLAVIEVFDSKEGMLVVGLISLVSSFFLKKMASSNICRYD